MILDDDTAAALLSQLGNPTRLKIIRALVRAGKSGMPVGEIQRLLEVPNSTLSHHLSHLRQVGLIGQQRESTVLRCRVEFGVIDRIVDADDRVYYQGRTVPIQQVTSPATSREVIKLMQATVRSGTARKPFKGYRRDKVLSRLRIGGKTGSINSRSDGTRFDWFVGFAEEKNGAGKIAVSIVVAHEKFIGRRAGEYARMAITRYFREYFARMKVKSTAVGKS